MSIQGRQKNRKPANNAQIVPVVLINGPLSSRGWERHRISLMNTQITLAPSLSTNKAAQTRALAYHFAVLCVWGGNCSQETTSEQSLRLLFWVPGSLWYAITSAWSEWWIEAWLRPPHFVSPEKGLRFLTMETVSTSPKQPLNLCICLTHFSPFLSSLKIFLCSSAEILHLSNKIPRSFLAVHSELAPKGFY